MFCQLPPTFQRDPNDAILLTSFEPRSLILDGGVIDPSVELRQGQSDNEWRSNRKGLPAAVAAKGRPYSAVAAAINTTVAWQTR